MCRPQYTNLAPPVLFDEVPLQHKNAIAFLLNSPETPTPFKEEDCISKLSLRLAPTTTLAENETQLAAETIPCLSTSKSPPKPATRRPRGARVPCEACTQTFGDAAALRKHVRAVHLKQKPFSCTTCHRRSPNAQILRSTSLHAIRVLATIAAHSVQRPFRSRMDFVATSGTRISVCDLTNVTCVRARLNSARTC